MGYDNNFLLYFHGGNSEERKQVMEEIEKESGYTLTDKDDEEAHLYESHWYDYERDITKVAKKHPDIIIEVWREGEERGDGEGTRFKKDERESVKLKYVWPEFKNIRVPDDNKYFLVVLSLSVLQGIERHFAGHRYDSIEQVKKFISEMARAENVDYPDWQDSMTVKEITNDVGLSPESYYKGALATFNDHDGEGECLDIVVIDRRGRVYNQ